MAAAPPDLSPPRLFAPCNGWTISDIALDFRIEERPLLAYHLQIAHDPDFHSLVDAYIGPRHNATPFEWKRTGLHYVPETLLPPGTYFWRARTCIVTEFLRVGQGKPMAPKVDTYADQWSETRTFHIVKSSETLLPPFAKFDAHNPLLLMVREKTIRNYGEDEFRAIPQDLKKNVGVIPIGHFEKRTIEEAADDYTELLSRGLGAFFDRGTMALCELEWVFKNFPQVTGVETDEMEGYWTYYPMQFKFFMQRMVQLCAIYGRLFLQAEGQLCAHTGILFDKFLLDTLKKYGEYVILMQKGNLNIAGHHKKAMYRGLWLDGVVSTYGTWFETFYWDHAGFRRLGECGKLCQYTAEGATLWMPSIMWARAFLLGAAEGAAVFVNSAIRPNTNLTAGAFVNPPIPDWLTFTLPAWRAIVQQKLVTPKVVAAEKTKIAVVARPNKLKSGKDHWYVDWEQIYKNTIGLPYKNSDYADLIPKNSRYSFFTVVSPVIERVPHPTTNYVPMDDLMTPEQIHAVFDPAYPASFEGNAFVYRTSDVFFVMNSLENVDEIQLYRLPLSEQGFVRQISGTQGVHTYVVGRVDEDSPNLWLQANTQFAVTSFKKWVYECPCREISINIELASEPSVISVIPEGGLVCSEWDSAASTLKLTLSNKAAQNAIDVFVQR